MVAAGRMNRLQEENSAEHGAADQVQEVKTAPPRSDTRDTELTALRRQIRSLKAALADARRDAHKSAGEPTAVAATDSDALIRARAALKNSESRGKALSQLVESLKAELAERDNRLQALTKPQDALRRNLAEKIAALDAGRRELTALRAEVEKQAAQIAALTPPPGEKDRVEALTQAVADRDRAMGEVLARAERAEADLKPLKAQLAKQARDAADLRTALEARSGELKQAAAGLADLRTKLKPLVPSTPAQQQAYMAGQMMADGLNRRIAGWAAAGMSVDTALFRSGLEDGLTRTLRLKAPEARQAQAAFMKAVQDGVTSHVARAQKQLSDLAKGRTALKSQHGITWYRVREGRAVEEGQPVRLSMTERVADGKEVSRVPPLTLRPGDSVPAVVRDGMYLPGEGGEVVAYALARDVYGELPLPAGVQPWTVMEYHLTGAPHAARPG
jgi:predicted  nucleic acid-binding Zn-ribbon protein